MSRRMSRRKDAARTVAFRVLRAVTSGGAYANLELARQRGGLSAADAAFVTELVAGTCRAMGSYDRVIERAGGRPLRSLQPAVIDVLRLGCHQLLAMRVPTHAAISATVDLAALEVGERVSGVVNAVLRKVAQHDWEAWLDLLTEGLDDVERLALGTHHPRWIVEAWAQVLPADELEAALAADNVAPMPHLVVRPGLAARSELGGEPARWSPYGAYAAGDPGQVAAVAEGRAGVQDEGSQLVALALSRVEGPSGWWLDLCAGPGGKSALLAGLAREQGSRLVAAELQEHRARLVAGNLRAYPEPKPVCLVTDGLRPAWAEASFTKVLADVPCTGLGALRRRPESRWRRSPADLPGLVALQRGLLASAILATAPGGVIAYVTCSPHPDETASVVAGSTGVEVLRAADYLPEVPDCASGDFVQLWPHRHGTDAMFLALLRRTA
ncbi:MAG TPA: RsmB/NOP family class I SAM-dependent RNA methyltransferase [Propionicimonas sp.]|nr:RsmB/NOP family class I SAM-dependent RNA methyltransferase [Propionicimonas sp.]